MSNGFPNIKGIPPVERAGQVLISTTSASEWGNIDDVALPDRLDSVGPLITDFNAPKASGWYRALNAINGPPGTTLYGMLFHQEWDGNNGHASQLFTPFYDNQGTLWFRISNTYVWQAWKKILPIDDTSLPMRLAGNRIATGDFNAVTQAGWYSGGGGTVNGPPTSYGEYSNVMTLAADNQQLAQLAFPFWVAEVWYRRCHSGTWQPWQKIVPLDDTSLPDRIISQSKQISDWNAATTTGWYCGNSAANSPPSAINQQFFGEMINWSTGGWGVQTVHTLTGNAASYEMWERQINNGSWLAWKKIAPIDDRLRAVSSLAPGNDANQAVENGWYHLSPGSANNPMSGNWTRLAVNNMNSTSDLTQIQTSYVDDSVWMRRKQDNIWRTWAQTWPVSSVPDSSLPNRLKIGESANVVADANNACQSGWWHCSSAATNTPYSADWYIHAISYDGQSGTAGYIKQIAYNFYNTDTYQRLKQAGLAFQAWTKTWPITMPAPYVLPTRLERDTTTYGDTVTDWNNATENGWHQGPPGTTNAPDGNWYIGMISAHRAQGGGKWVQQELWAFTQGTFSEPRWRRACNNDAWTGWQRIGDQHMQCGQGWVTMDSSFAGTVWFPTAFQGTPVVVVSTLDGSAGDDNYILNVRTANASYFQVAGVNRGEGASVFIFWIAMYK